MLKISDFQPDNSFFTQIATKVEGTVRCLFIFKVPPAADEQFIKAWTRHGEIMSAFPGYGSELLHKAVSNANGETMYLNYSTWDSLAQFSAALGSPESQEILKSYPDEITLTAEVMKRVAIPGRCEGDD
jgi:heme-degrading monooxygenase HmoA